MWRCPNCGESIEDSFEVCWQCGTGADGTRPEADSGPDEPRPPVSDENLATVASFAYAQQAELARVRLEQAGIRAFVADEDTLVGVGQVRLQVAEHDLQRATEIIEAADARPAVEFACQECGQALSFPRERKGHVEVCPNCGNYVDVPE